MIESKKILIVEDNPNDIELILEALSESNLAKRVVVVNDGKKALEYLNYEGSFKKREKEYPAVILLDVKMPLMDGIEVLQIIKSDPKLKSIPVVMLSSSSEDHDLKKCYELGVNAFIVKPVSFNQFIDVVKQCGIFWTNFNKLPNN